MLAISYARVDRPQVREIVDLLIAANAAEGAVFWDGHLVAGEDWYQQLKRHINRAGKLFVFWCEHSKRSRQVRKEYLYARKRKKRIIPVLLDNTPLSAELAPIHGIDMRRSIRHAPFQPERRRMRVGATSFRKVRLSRSKKGSGGGTWHYSRRRPAGSFKEIDDVGRSLNVDRRRTGHLKMKPLFRSRAEKVRVIRQFRYQLRKP